MIYTIRCKGPSCGARFQKHFPGLYPDEDIAKLSRMCAEKGWEGSTTGGWLCPFDAPKEAQQRINFCGSHGCMNLTVAESTEEYVANGWRLVNVGEGGVKESWFCPACWKTTQPDPMPIFDQAEAMHQAEFSIEQVKAIAAEVCGEMLCKMVEEAIRIADGNTTALSSLECLEAAIPQITTKGPDNAEPTRRTRSENEAGEPAGRSVPSEVPDSLPPDGPTRRTEDFPF